MNALQSGIRNFQPQDEVAIANIIRLIWTIGIDYRREQYLGRKIDNKPWYEWKFQAVVEKTRQRAKDWFVTEVNDRVVGFIGMATDGVTRIGRVLDNGIHPEFRNQGLGQKQLRFVLDQLRARGMTVVEVETGLDEEYVFARRIYEKAGFEPLLDSRIYIMKMGKPRS